MALPRFDSREEQADPEREATGVVIRPDRLRFR
jgi:hypothetical protein